MPQVDIQDLVGAYAASVGDGAPAYERIKRAIRSRIEVGEWQEGDQLRPRASSSPLSACPG